MNFSAFQIEVQGTACETCGLRISGAAYKIPSVSGVHCTVECIEAHLFGHESCRWCGSEMLKTYTGVDSRLCSDGCSENYYKHVVGDRTAAVGKGRRLILWLQGNQPDRFAMLAEESREEFDRKSKLGRPTKNGHSMSAAERKREERLRRKPFDTPSFVTNDELIANP